MKAFTDTLAHEVQSSEGDILRIKADLKDASKMNRNELKDKLEREKVYCRFFKQAQSECNLLGESHGVTIKTLSMVNDEFITDKGELCPGTTRARGKLLQLVINYLIR